MRRLAPILLAPALALAACGGGGGGRSTTVVAEGNGAPSATAHSPARGARTHHRNRARARPRARVRAAAPLRSRERRPRHGAAAFPGAPANTSAGASAPRRARRPPRHPRPAGAYPVSVMVLPGPQGPTLAPPVTTVPAGTPIVLRVLDATHRGHLLALTGPQTVSLRVGGGTQERRVGPLRAGSYSVRLDGAPSRVPATLTALEQR